MAPMTPPSRPVEQPPRPPNAWMLYRAEKSKEFTEGQLEGVGLPQSQISKILGQRWTQEPKAVRDIYERKAAEAKREHDRMYPGYKYTPIPKAERQKRRAEAKAAKERARAEAKMAKASGRKSGRTSPQRGSETGSVGAGHAIPVPPDFLRVPHDPSAVPYPSAITQYPVTLFRPSLNATSYLSWSTKQWMARSMQQQGVASARSDGGSVSNDRHPIAHEMLHDPMDAPQPDAPFNTNVMGLTFNLENAHLDDPPLRQNVTVEEMIARASSAKSDCSQESSQKDTLSLSEEELLAFAWTSHDADPSGYSFDDQCGGSQISSDEGDSELDWLSDTIVAPE